MRIDPARTGTTTEVCRLEESLLCEENCSRHILPRFVATDPVVGTDRIASKTLLDRRGKRAIKE